MVNTFCIYVSFYTLLDHAASLTKSKNHCLDPIELLDWKHLIWLGATKIKPMMCFTYFPFEKGVIVMQWYFFRASHNNQLNKRWLIQSFITDIYIIPIYNVGCNIYNAICNNSEKCFNSQFYLWFENKPKKYIHLKSNCSEKMKCIL